LFPRAFKLIGALERLRLLLLIIGGLLLFQQPARAIERNQAGDVMRLGEERSGYLAKFQRDQLGLEIERTLPGGVRSRWERDRSGRPLQHSIDGAISILRRVSYRGT